MVGAVVGESTGRGAALELVFRGGLGRKLEEVGEGDVSEDEDCGAEGGSFALCGSCGLF